MAVVMKVIGRPTSPMTPKAQTIETATTTSGNTVTAGRRKKAKSTIASSRKVTGVRTVKSLAIIRLSRLFTTGTPAIKMPSGPT